MRTSTRTRYRHFAPFALITSTALLLTAWLRLGRHDRRRGECGGQGRQDPHHGRRLGRPEGRGRRQAAPVRRHQPHRGGRRRRYATRNDVPGRRQDRRRARSVDFADAVAKVLGIELKTEQAGFEAILPALDSGKYDFGASNFGVTDERRKTIDFVTYINDGQGFATRSDSKLAEITTDDARRGERRQMKRTLLRGERAGGEQEGLHLRRARRRTRCRPTASRARSGRHSNRAAATS